MSNKDSRIDALSKRFSKRAGDGRGQKRSKRERKLRSVLLDETLWPEFDKVHHKVNSEFYPTKITKARFMEALIECGLSNLDEVKTALEKNPE